MVYTQLKKTKLDVTSKKGNSFIAKEQAIKEKCNLLKIPYEVPKANETSVETKKRRQRLTRQCKNLLSKTTNNCTNVKPVTVPTNYNLPQKPPVNFHRKPQHHQTNIPANLTLPPLKSSNKYSGKFNIFHQIYHNHFLHHQYAYKINQI